MVNLAGGTKFELLLPELGMELPRHGARSMLTIVIS